ncbi:helix-turn-helix transcriptional regulator [uncultured Flavobacterium sp.]|uniref:helix-turn-helix domain-containing protein n=1 Tax=uncultured Flavobacterium sp. TaxID=165435 RepID=UPI003081FD3B
MNQLNKGEFYGTNYQKSIFQNTIITDTEYTHSKVDWHYHENPYFTYLLQGKLFESNKKESYYLEQGSLLFHNWQDAHYNIKPPGFARGFHIELNENWFLNYDIQTTDFEGSMHLKNPLTINLMNKVFIESKINDQYSNLGIESLMVELFSTIKETKKISTKKPDWVHKLQELLFEEQIDYSLAKLSSILGIHPIHLSREFNRYFGTSLGNDIRVIKVNKAFCLIVSNKISMTDICYQCGFCDQSHFISSFKKIYNTTPAKLFRKILKC